MPFSNIYICKCTVILEYDTVGFKWIMVEEYVTVDTLENTLQCGMWECHPIMRYRV